MDIIASDGTTRPAFVSVETTARFLGVSRGTAYSLAHSYLDSGEGIRCMRLGARLLVPVAWLLEVAGNSPSLTSSPLPTRDTNRSP